MTYFIAEAGVNHGGSLPMAQAMISVAKAAKADCIKFQLFTGLLDKEPDLARFHLDIGAMATLKADCKRIGIDFLCTPFSIEDADALYLLGERRMKVSHRHDPELWDHINSLEVSVIASVTSVDGARELRKHLTPDVIMYCSPDYPAQSVDLIEMLALERHAPRFGYSDHTKGIVTAISAVMSGASYIEKHLCLSNDDFEAAWSATPGEFARMTEVIR